MKNLFSLNIKHTSRLCLKTPLNITCKLINILAGSAPQSKIKKERYKKSPSSKACIGRFKFENCIIRAGKRYK